MIVFVCLLFSSSIFAADGWLYLYNTHTEEKIKIQYEIGQNIIPEAKQKIDYFLRSWDDDEVSPIDLQLIRYLDTIQDRVAPNALIYIISGFRSKAYNQKLIKRGRTVGVLSYHQKGKAIDFYIPSESPLVLKYIALDVVDGGVGYYSKYQFLHIDTGPKRSWEY